MAGRTVSAREALEIEIYETQRSGTVEDLDRVVRKVDRAFKAGKFSEESRECLRDAERHARAWITEGRAKAEAERDAEAARNREIEARRRASAPYLGELRLAMTMDRLSRKSDANS